MIRTFIGVRVAQEVGHTLENWIEQIRPSIDAKRWYGLDQFHITVHFLGDQSEQQIEEIDAICHNVSQTMPAFSMALSSLGLFERSKVIWAGVRGDLPQLQELYKHLQPILRVAGNNDRVRPTLTPHITLGRLRTIPSKEVIEEAKRRVEANASVNMSWRVVQFERFESVFTPGGVQYPTRKAYPLQRTI